MEKLLHTEDPSLKKESGKHKKEWNWKTKKFKFLFGTDQKERDWSLFFYKEIKYISFDDSRLLKENYFDALTIDLKIYKWQI